MDEKVEEFCALHFHEPCSA